MSISHEPGSVHAPFFEPETSRILADPAESADSESLQGILHGTQDPTARIAVVHNYKKDEVWYKRVDRSEVGLELAQLASEPTSEELLSVRITALDRALEYGFGEAMFANSAFEGIKNQAVGLSYRFDDTGVLDYAKQDWRLGYAGLLGKEGVNTNLVWGNPEELPYDGQSLSTFQDHFPFQALVLFDRLRVAESSGEPIPAEAAKFLPLAHEFTTKLAAEEGLQGITKLLPVNEWPLVHTLWQYGQRNLTHRSKLIEFFNDDTGRMQKYKEVLADLQHSSSDLDSAFPQSTIGLAFSGLIADAFFAIQQHEVGNNGHTAVKLPLNNELDVLPLDLKKDEPLELLRALASACQSIGSVYVSEQYYDARNKISGSRQDLIEKRSVLATQGKGFSIYRLLDKHGENTVSVYIRPRGDHTYDSALEYGRNGEGVEASISYVADPYLQAGELIEIGKHRRQGPDNRISIRLDREGVAPENRAEHPKRDPTQERGTLSLDVGSIIGDEAWLGTRIGRFLAWGNLLRTQTDGTVTQLNHVADFYESTGTAEEFAAEAEKMIARLERKRFSLDDLEKKYSGSLALAQSLNKRD